MEPSPALAAYHKLLQRQIRKTLGDNPTLTPEIAQLLQRVSEAYTQADDDHALIERSLELSSEELSAINKTIEQKVLDRTEELRREHIRFMSSISSLGVGFVMCDPAGQVIMINPAMQRILAGQQPGGSANPAAADGTNASRPVRASWTFDEIASLLRPGFDLRVALEQCWQSGEQVEANRVTLAARILRLFVAPILAPNHAQPPYHAQPSAQPTANLGTVILVEDITEQAILDRSKDEFFSIASHELRTPLTAIRGNASTMQKYFADKLADPDMADMVSDIYESAVRLIDLVDDFLDMSALEQGKLPLEPVDMKVQDLIADISRDLQKICADKGLQFTADASLAGLPLVTADETRVKQVLYNLVGNAVKFTEHGGITLAGRADDALVHLSVSDTGRGMSATDQQLLFHKFQQAGSSLLTRDTPKGTGLGLYISKLIVERLGGTIALEHSAVGKGSSFVFSLPRAKNTKAGAAT